MDKIELERRTKVFALRSLRLAKSIRPNLVSGVLVRQFVRSSSSIGSNYREANRAVSRREFKNKIGTVAKEACETQFWLELLVEGGFVAEARVRSLGKECEELIRIFNSVFRTLSKRE